MIINNREIFSGLANLNSSSFMKGKGLFKIDRETTVVK